MLFCDGALNITEVWIFLENIIKLQTNFLVELNQFFPNKTLVIILVTTVNVHYQNSCSRFSSGCLFNLDKSVVRNENESENILELENKVEPSVGISPTSVLSRYPMQVRPTKVIIKKEKRQPVPVVQLMKNLIIV